MKTTNTLILIGIVVIISTMLYSFQSNPTPKKYQYMMIFAKNYDFDYVFISIDGKEYKEISLIKQIKDSWDFNPMINLIHQYENEGWELVSVTCQGSPSFFYLRREVE